MNIWHDISKDRIQKDNFMCYIEIQKGSKSKYELDKETGVLKLDRVLYTSTVYPASYGFIPRTLADDGDPLDVFVLCSQPIEKMSLVRCYPIGVVFMTDRDESDEKIIAIPFGDPQYNCYKDIADIPEHVITELKHFLSVYKQLENKKVKVLKISNKQVAVNTIKKNIETFEEKFGKRTAKV